MQKAFYQLFTSHDFCDLVGKSFENIPEAERCAARYRITLKYDHWSEGAEASGGALILLHCSSRRGDKAQAPLRESW